MRDLTKCKQEKIKAEKETCHVNDFRKCLQCLHDKVCTFHWSLIPWKASLFLHIIASTSGSNHYFGKCAVLSIGCTWLEVLDATFWETWSEEQKNPLCMIVAKSSKETKRIKEHGSFHPQLNISCPLSLSSFINLTLPLLSSALIPLRGPSSTSSPSMSDLPLPSAFLFSAFTLLSSPVGRSSCLLR